MLESSNVKDSNDDKPVSPTVTPSLTHDTSSGFLNLTETPFLNWPSNFNSTTAVTGFYVFACLSAVIVVYFVVKAIRLRRRKSKIRRYGIIASREDVEMTPLGDEDEDEDSTVFDINEHSRA